MSLPLVFVAVPLGTNVVEPSFRVVPVVVFAVVAEGILGAVEGVVLASPLAAILGRFGTAG